MQWVGRGNKRECRYNFTIFFHADGLAPRGSFEARLTAEIVHVDRVMVEIKEERSPTCQASSNVDVSQMGMIEPQGELVRVRHVFVFYFWHSCP
jgi:hypothetical protein